MLYLVRHGTPVVEPARPPHEWELDPAAYDAVTALRDSGRLPGTGAAWYASPEPKALATARLLHDGEIPLVPALREHERAVTAWFDDVEEWRGAVRRAFTDPDTAALPGWEPLSRTEARLVPAVRRILDLHGEQDVVLVGHGTAWTLLASALTGQPPDLERWESLAMPDLLTIP